MGSYRIQRFTTAEALAKVAASLCVTKLQGRDSSLAFALALSGGRIARTFLSALADATERRNKLFRGVHFFWGDERCVPPSDPESNYALAEVCFFKRVPIESDQVHRVKGELKPNEAAEVAAGEMRQIATTGAMGQPVLDLVFLGMGEDGHVASLFPGEPKEVVDDPAVYRPVRATKPPPERITLGYRTLAAARDVWVLVSGSGKGPILEASLRGDVDTPLARLLRLRSTTEVFANS